MQLLKQLFPLLPIIALLSACKKEPGDPVMSYDQGTGTCTLKSTHTHANTANPAAANFSYNSDGSLASVAAGQEITTFSYSGNTIYVNTADTLGNILRKDTITHTGTQIIAIASGGRGGFYRSSFFYDGNGQLVRSRSTEYNNVSEEYYTWLDGDVITDSMVINGKMESISRFEYYSDKPNQYADPITLDFFMRYSIPLYSTRHLLRKADYGSNGSYALSYAFDADGKVITTYSVPSTGQDTVTTTNTYECR